MSTEVLQDRISKQKAAIWYLRKGRLAWFWFCYRDDAYRLARRLKTDFGVAAVVMEYWWDPDYSLEQL
jgi:hypothetical protein